MHRITIQGVFCFLAASALAGLPPEAEMFTHRITAARVAAHCVNWWAEKERRFPKDWRSALERSCGHDTLRHLKDVQFQEFLSPAAARLIQRE